jgi:hypothetical protein
MFCQMLFPFIMELKQRSAWRATEQIRVNHKGRPWVDKHLRQWQGLYYSILIHQSTWDSCPCHLARIHPIKGSEIEILEWRISFLLGGAGPEPIHVFGMTFVVLFWSDPKLTFLSHKIDDRLQLSNHSHNSCAISVMVQMQPTTNLDLFNLKLLLFACEQQHVLAKWQKFLWSSRDHKMLDEDFPFSSGYSSRLHAPFLERHVRSLQCFGHHSNYLVQVCSPRVNINLQFLTVSSQFLTSLWRSRLPLSPLIRHSFCQAFWGE